MRILEALGWVLWRLARIVLLLAIVGGVLLPFSPHAPLAARDQLRGIAPQRVDDRAGLFSLADRGRMDVYLGRIERETGIEIHLLFASPPSGESLEQFAAESATRLGIGRENGGLHGLLVVYDPEAERLRVELGYGLEEYFPDSFIGYLIERHAASFFQAGDPVTGLRLSIRILHERMRDHMMGGRFDPTPLLAREGPYVSGGAGASGSAPLGAEHGPMPRGLDGFPRELDAATKAYFGPQPTPEAAARRYLEWLATGQFDPYVGLLTGPSQEYLASLPMTPAYFDHILMLYAGKEYRIAERGDMAMLYFTSTPLVSPLFLRRDREGWRMDIVEEVHSTREYAGGWATWGITTEGEAYPRFRDLLVDFGGGLLRVADGDNRPLPTPEVQRRREELERSAQRIRDLPPDLLAEPTPPERDEFGYRIPDVDGREVVRLLRERRYAELNRLLAHAQDAARRDHRDELVRSALYRSFERVDADLAALLEEWVAEYPRSPEPLIARGVHRLALAWDARGADYIRRTPDESIERMERHAKAAFEDFAAAVRLDPTQVQGYIEAIRLLLLFGAQEEARELLRRGLELAPLSFELRYQMSFLLWPKWGGSFGQIEALAREAEPYVDANPRLRALAGLVHFARGDALEPRKRTEEAIEEYTRALEFGELSYVRLRRGEAYLRLGDAEASLADVNRAWQHRPYSPDILEARARAYTMLGKQAASPEQRRLLLERAERDISLAQELQPESDRALLLVHVRACLVGPGNCE